MTQDVFNLRRSNFNLDFLMTGEDELTAGHNTGGKAPEIMIISGS